jgi:tape measure domain-containing protein
VALNVGELNAVLTADTSDYMRGLKQAERAANSFEQSIKGVKRSIEKTFGDDAIALSEKLALGLVAAAAAAGAFAVASVKMQADMRSTRKAFTSLIGDEQKAAKFLDDLQKMADETPFEFPGLTNASRKLLAFGFALEDILPIMGVVGDTAAALNLGQEGINSVIRALGQIRSKGKASAEEISLQIAELGIPAWEYLAKALGKTIPETMKMVENGVVDSTTTINAILFGMQERFKGGMDVLSKEINGLLSTIRDKTKTVMREIGEDIIKAFDIQGKLEYAVSYLGAFADYVQSKGLNEALKNMIPKELTFALFALAGAMAAAAVAVAIFAASTIAAVAPLAPLIIVGLALAEAAWVIWQAWEPLGDLFTGIWEYIVAVVEEKWAVIQIIANDAYNTFKPFIDALSSLAEAFGQAWDWIVNIVVGAWNNILSVISSGVQKAISLVSSLSTAFGGPSFESQILGTNDYDVRKNTALGKITNALDGIGTKLTESVKGLSNIVKTPFQIPKFGGLSGGGGGGAASGGGGGGAASKYENQLERMEELTANLNAKILGETGTTFEKSMSKLSTEVLKMQKDINAAMKAGVDVKDAQTALDEYNKVVTANLEKTWQEAWQNLKDQSALVHTQLVGDAQAEADAELQIALTKLNKEREEKLKAVQRDQDDADAKLAIEKWYNDQVTLLEKQNMDKHRQNQLQIYQWQVQLNQNLLAMHQQTAAQTDAANLAVYNSQILYLQGQLAEIEKYGGKFTEQWYKVMNDMATVTQQKNDIMSNDLASSWDLAMKDIQNQQFNYKNLMVSTWNDISNAVSGHFKSMITGAESMGEGIKGVIRDLTTSILEMFAEIMVQQYIMQPIRNWFTGLLGGTGGGGGASSSGGGYADVGKFLPNFNFAAKGGLASGWTMVGEKGPELVNFSNPGRVYPADETERMLSGGRSNPITVNVNVSGVKDANSFMQSRGQIGAAAAKSINRAIRRNL